MKIFCDDGSTNVKLAWFEGKTLKSAVSVNSFRHNWKVEGLGSSRTYNYLLDGRKYTYDPVSEAAISTTHIEYQYSDTNVLAVHHALLNVAPLRGEHGCFAASTVFKPQPHINASAA
ncbi:mediator of plasmid stability [Klebsiella pneumoniae]|nr:mediator of plasmid stability [Klebsiella pneumoniae]STU16730.1 mediator of plasmid stability [Klebsiella pneumoniae]STU17149.1 mediator of plasmid stability [Klebsiella pneumoniae]STU17171.1 mediator of plasmid stability [Klebsiella pneumoniae]